jgi:hypothetical protein
LIARYSVQSGGAGLICGPHVKNRTLKLKHRVHTLKLLRNRLKFMEMTQLDCPLPRAEWWGWTYTWAPRQEPDPKTKTLRSHLKIFEKLAEIYADDSI